MGHGLPPSLPAGGAVLDVIRACPQPALPQPDHHQALLRRLLPLAAAERELIATHVPGLNARGCGSGVLQAIAQPRRGRYSNRCLSGRDKRHLSQRTSA